MLGKLLKFSVRSTTRNRSLLGCSCVRSHTLKTFGVQFQSLSTTPMSYAHGTSVKPLIGDTISAFFNRQVLKHGSSDALIVKHQNVRWSYKQLGDHTESLAQGLYQIGVRRGDRVGIWSPNNSEWLMTQLATAKLGAVLVNINPAYRSEELFHALKLVEVSTLIMAPSLKKSNFIDIIHEVVPELASCKAGSLRAEKLPQLKNVVRLRDDVTPGMFNFHEILSLGRKAGQEVMTAVQNISDSLQPDDPINIQFTSGTTGRPKGATLSHHNILNNGYFVGEGLQLSERDRMCIPVPLYHCMGMVMGNLGALSHGSTLVYPSEVFDALAVLKCLVEERCTVAYGVPTMFLALLNHQDLPKYDIKRTLVKGIMAGSLCPRSVMERCRDMLGMTDIAICYGMTETSPVSLATFATNDSEKRLSTVGATIPHVEIKIIDTNPNISPEQRAMVPRGQVGEVCTRGYSVMLGYWNDAEKTAETIDNNGWLHTGDLAKMDEDGTVTIEGRSKDMVIRGGENIYPKEIEELMYRHPFVRDVQVIGLPDEKYGEELCAWMVIDYDTAAATASAENAPYSDRGTLIAFVERSIRHFCFEKMAHFKVPRYMHFVEEFPLTVTGKVKKFEMRRQSMEVFDISVPK